MLDGKAGQAGRRTGSWLTSIPTFTHTHTHTPLSASVSHSQTLVCPLQGQSYTVGSIDLCFGCVQTTAVYSSVSVVQRVCASTLSSHSPRRPPKGSALLRVEVPTVVSQSFAHHQSYRRLTAAIIIRTELAGLSKKRKPRRCPSWCSKVFKQESTVTQKDAAVRLPGDALPCFPRPL